MSYVIRTRYACAPSTGERLEIRQTIEGGYVCPVCGRVGAPGGEAPWEETIGERTVAPFATGSHNICVSCCTQYGYDDIPPKASGSSIAEMWWQLRIKWLSRVGWTSDAVRQVVDHLAIPEDELRRRAFGPKP